MEREELMQTLRDLAELFRELCRTKNYVHAKSCYEEARKLAVNNHLTEGESAEIFGVRGDRGVILRVGAFPEEDVIDMYEWTVVRCRNAGKK